MLSDMYAVSFVLSGVMMIVIMSATIGPIKLSIIAVSVSILSVIYAELHACYCTVSVVIKIIMLLLCWQ